MSDAGAEWTIGRLIEWTRGFFEKKGIPQPRLEAEILLAHVLGLERIALYMQYEQTGRCTAARDRFRDLVKRRGDREPTRYLVGGCEFLSLALKVTPACLIPRPETEQLVEECLAPGGVAAASAARPRAGRRGLPTASRAAAARRAAPAAPRRPGPAAVTAIDLCTGCGCIAIGLAATCRRPASRPPTSRPRPWRWPARTPRPTALADRIVFLEGDLYAPLDAADVQPADFLLANPPYVTEADWARLEPEIRDHEPRAALVAGPRAPRSSSESSRAPRRT